MKNPRDIVIRPIVSEKSYSLVESGVYTFVVAPDANKIEIRHAVEAIFNVKVKSVNTLTRAGKTVRNRRNGITATRPDQKRAIVTLAGDDRIPLFEN